MLTSHSKASRRRLRLVKEGEGLPGEGSPYPKASLWLRGCARAVDLAWGALLVFCLGNAGGVLAMLYLLFGDGFLNGQSPGKRIFGLRVMYLPGHRPARYRESFLRNAAFGLLLTLYTLPGYGPVVFGVAFVAYGLWESRHVWKEPLGLRKGDVWAHTQVVDGKALDKQLRWQSLPPFPSASGSARRAIFKEVGPQAQRTCGGEGRAQIFEAKPGAPA